MNSIKIIKNRSDIGAGTRGSDMGIDAIEIAAINSGNEFFNNYPYVDVETENEAVYEKQKTLYAKRIGKVLQVCTRLASEVTKTLAGGEFPLVLSGDHSSALGTISGLKLAYPDKRLGVVWVDAHADLHSPHSTPSGNVHGMPLAAALAADNLERKINEVKDETESNWEGLKNIGGISPKVLHDDLVFFGVRDTEEPEDYAIESNGIKNFKVEELRFRGLKVCLEEALARLSNCDHIYISFDVDSLDCDLISYGTGTPVSKGFDVEEAKAIINGLIGSGKVSCLEIVEVNPTLDNRGNRMAEAAFEVLDSAVNHLIKH
ncbi:MAG: arginase [Limisphaerales bacterium]|jgi:arginase